MAARKRKSARGGGGFAPFARKTLGLAAVIAVGMVAGYCWRSYYPLALPIESPLVSDRLSTDTRDTRAADLARAATLRADKAERERDRLKERLERLEQNQQQTERQLGDLQVRSVLQQAEN